MANLGFSSLPGLPLEVQENIVKDFSYDEIVNFCLTQAGFADLCNDEAFWQEILERRDAYYPDSNPDWQQVSAKEMVRRYDTMYGVIISLYNQEKPLYYKWTPSLDRVIGLLIWYDVIRHTILNATITVLPPGIGGELGDDEISDLLRPYVYRPTKRRITLEDIGQVTAPIYEFASPVQGIISQEQRADLLSLNEEQSQFGRYRAVGDNLHYELFVTGINEEMYDAIVAANKPRRVTIAKYEISPEGKVKGTRRGIIFS